MKGGRIYSSKGLDGKTNTIGTTVNAYKLGDENIIADAAGGGGGALANFECLIDDINSSIGDLIKLFADGDFEQLEQLLPYDEYCRISAEIYSNFRIGNQYQAHENIRLITRDTLLGIYRGVCQYQELVACLNSLQKSQDKASILDDRERLLTYINSLTNSKYLFPESTVGMTVAPQIKEPYNTYVRLFGFPDKALFNPDLLAVVKDAVDRLGDNAYNALLPQKDALITQYNATIITVQDANANNN